MIALDQVLNWEFQQLDDFFFIEVRFLVFCYFLDGEGKSGFMFPS